MSTPVVVRPARAGRRTDTVVARVLVLVLGATILVTARIAFPSWTSASSALRHPLALQQWQALWTGLLSADLMIAQVVLLARLPWLERTFGRATLTRWHRQAAWWSCWLLVVHVLLFVLQRSLREPGRAGAAMVTLFLTGRWMLLASVGTVLVLLVVVTSIARARRWLRYETWHLVHLWSYAGIGLALPHMLISADFGAGWVAAYWWTLYLTALALVLGFRIGVPLGRSLRHDLRVADVRPEAPGVVTVEVEGRRLDELRVSAGQFLTWRFLGGPGRTRGHPYSLSAAPTSDRLRVTVGGAGDGSLRAADLSVGSRVLVEGPYGVPLADRRRHARLLMLAAGVGITPFRVLLEEVAFQPGEAVLVIRARDGEHVVLGEEVRVLAAEHDVELVVVAGPRRAAYSWLPVGTVGSEGEVLRDLVPDLVERDVLVCGPPGWSDAVRRAATSVGVAARDLHQEDFGW